MATFVEDRPVPQPIPTVRDLRRRWKPFKERLTDHPTAIRFHRACSWLDRAEKLQQAGDSDLVLITQWMAFNALYGHWDDACKEPAADRESWRSFVSTSLKLDAAGRICDVLVSEKGLVLSILEDAYLTNHFWKEPSPAGQKRAQNQRQRALARYVENSWTLILDELLDRVYLLRCQLVHGAATHGGKLNRTSVRRATAMLSYLLPAFMSVMIDDEARTSLGQLCYPPIRSLFSLAESTTTASLRVIGKSG